MKLFEILDGVPKDDGIKLPDDWIGRATALSGRYFSGEHSLVHIFDVKEDSVHVSRIDFKPMGDDSSCMSLIVKPISWEAFVFSPYLFWSDEITREEYKSQYDQWEARTKELLLLSFDDIKNIKLNGRPKCMCCNGDHKE